MARRIVRAAGLVVLGGIGWLAATLTRGQDSGAPVVAPPRPPVVSKPPAPLAPPPVTPQTVRPSVDLDKMDEVSRQAYLNARRAAEWLQRMNTVKGRFLPGWIPDLKAPLTGDHPLRQAGAAFALARAAAYFKDDNQALCATHAALTLLEDTMPGDKPDLRHPVLPARVVNRLAYSALTVLVVCELPSPARDLVEKSGQLCNYLRQQQKEDGSFALVDSGEAPALDASNAVYPALALYALLRSQRLAPAEWKLQAARKALPYYRRLARQSLESACWFATAWAEAFMLTKEKDFAEAALEINDWICTLQYERIDAGRPRWFGGFMGWRDGKTSDGDPSITSADCLRSLAEGCRVTRVRGDVQRHDRYVDTLKRGLQFLSTLQYAEADVQHFAEWYRPTLVGGFHPSHQDGHLRIDYAQQGLTALLAYLTSVPGS